MPSNRFKLPKITWGASFANTLSIGYPLDNVTAGDEPRAGSVFDRSTAGVEDAWITGVDFLLTADIRWIPQVDTAAPVATGWDGTTGVRSWLSWARQKNQFRFYPDATSGTFITCYLADPMQGVGAFENDGTRKLTVTFRNTATAFDGY
jgi:hypothetical protein